MSLLLWLIYLAGCWGLADIFIKQAQFDIQQWQTKELTLNTWQVTHSTLQWAVKLEPQHPDFLEFMGMAYFLHKNLKVGTAKKLTADYHALNYFLKAAKQRPVSAYAWANIVIMKHHLKQYDKQLFKALETAILLGPWEPFVQLTVAEVGLANWDRLPPKTQLTVLTMIEQGMRWQSKSVRTLIEKYQRKEVVCKHSGQKTVFADFCQ
jgi:hypothetical protein